MGADGEFVSWDQRFFDPIMLPGRKPLVTLRDAAPGTWHRSHAADQAMRSKSIENFRSDLRPANISMSGLACCASSEISPQSLSEVLHPK